MKKIERADKSELWRAGVLEVWSPAFGAWVRHNERVTIRPGQSVTAMEAELSKQRGEHVRVYIPDL